MTTDLDELLPGDRVVHVASDREGQVVELRSRRWLSIPEALVRFDDGDERWVVRPVLRRVDG